MQDEIVEVKIQKRSIHLIVWLVPLIALIIGGWMLYRYYSNLGPQIQITFQSSGGLEPKHSYVKFREVKVGRVERIEILKKGVRVYARVNKDILPFLNETTKFWIVKPEIGLGKVRGLDALMSGAYIQMSAKLGKRSKLVFQGLEEPPLIEDKRGSTVRLQASSSFALEPGMPVYYRQLRVGAVKKIDLASDGQRVNIYLFIRHPYDRFINDTSRFWNIKSVRLELTDEGLEVRMGSLSQMLMGGVGFATKNLGQKSRISLQKPFILYPSKSEALQKKLGLPREQFVRFLLDFDVGTGYLGIGSPVRFEGYKVGEVEDVASFFDLEHRRVNSKVLIRLDVSAFQNSPKISGMDALRKAVQKGLKAKLQQSNFLTKSLFVNLVFEKEGGELKPLGNGVYALPTLPYRKSKLLEHLDKILTKLENLPIERALEAFSALLEKNQKPLRQSLLSLHRTLSSLHKLLESNETKALPKDLHTTLRQLQKALKEFTLLAKGYDANSTFKAQLTQTLYDIDKSAKSLHKVLLKLDKKPNALIFGD